MRNLGLSLKISQSPSRLSLSWRRVLVLMLALSAGIVRGDEAADEYSLAAGLYQRMRWELAAEAFSKFLKDHPQHEKAPTARLYHGLTLVKLKDYQAARDVLRIYVKEAPQSRNLPHALYRVGECSYLLDDFKAAEPELAAFIERFPKDPLVERALPYLAEVQLRLNKPDAAAESYDRSLKLFPEGVLAEDSRFGLARSYELLKKTPEAVRLYRELAANRTGELAPQAQFNLGALYFDSRQFAEAAAAYGELETQFPKSALVPAAQLNRGYALYQQGNFQAAISQFDAAAKDERQATEATYWKGLSLKSLGQLPAAAQVFQTLSEQNPPETLAQNVLYHWADTEQRQGRLEEARQHFLAVVERWPAGDLADDSLHRAAVVSFELGDKARTQELLDQFAAKYARSGLRWHQEILRGRLDLLNDKAPAAQAHFERVLKESESQNARSWASVYLGHALHQQEKFAEALTATNPLAAQLDKEPRANPLAGVYLLRAASHMALAKQHLSATPPRPAEARPAIQGAIDAAGAYLTREPQGAQADQALALRAVAAAHGGLKPAATADLATLREKFPKSRHLNQTAYDVAEIAYANGDFEWSQELFAGLASLDAAAPLRVKGLSGLGWSAYKRQQFAESAAAFGRVVAEHPADAAAPEAGFMRGKALQDGKQPAEAIAAYQETLRDFPKSEYAYTSGLQAARLLGETKKIPEADAAYAALVAQFPQPKHLDKLLDEWALLNYAAERFERADEIFRRLIKDVPDSDLADNARLSLAESELLAGRIEQAEAQFRALRENPQADDGVRQTALTQLIGIALDRQEWKTVRDLCRELSERFPEGKHHGFAELHWAEADLNLDNAAAAVERLDALKSGKDRPESRKLAWYPQVFALLAEAQFRVKNYAGVAETVADFREWDPKADLLYVALEVLGRSHKAQAKFPEAREAFAQVIAAPAGRRTETAAKAQFLIAETYLLEKNFKNAEEEYLKVEILYKFPEWQAPALFQAAACQEELARWEDAVRSYESLIKDFPQSPYAAMARERVIAARKHLSPKS